MLRSAWDVLVGVVRHEFARRQDFYLAVFLLPPADFTRIASELKNPAHARSARREPISFRSDHHGTQFLLAVSNHGRECSVTEMAHALLRFSGGIRICANWAEFSNRL